VTHNDIKPANIVLSSQSKRLKIIDFGSATPHGKRVDVTTYNYTAPEIAMNSARANGKIDAFCAGQVLHQWLTGNPYNWANLDSQAERKNVFSLVWKMHRAASGYIDKENSSDLVAHFNANIPAKLQNLESENRVELDKCRDVLTKLLEGNHERRFSAEQAAGMDFFQGVRGLNTIGRIFEKINGCQPSPESSSESRGSAPESRLEKESLQKSR
jgi:serine/threonine protein kinase